MAQVVYLGHSAFLIDTGPRALVFDYTGGSMPAIPDGKAVYALYSHAHADHYVREAALSLHAARLFFGCDIARDLPGSYLRPGDAADADGIRVEAYESTDAGVSFLVSADGLTVFHAGDLNFWHWRAESTAAEVSDADTAFRSALSPLAGRKPDIAMFPVDPRMGEGYAEGAERFVETVRPKLFVPMHFWNRPEAAKAFAQSNMPAGTRAVALTVPGESETIG